ncbi:MAG: SagB/ThcOx family dehydrogenase [Methanosarcina flavescens]|jgi:SagB-type dehydrogenase family enzyme|uniref:SagB/ThcOx family dehydrogenase n=1 Tax=Methanosarcina flavescens TaxID=1715806 RepID=A0A660HV95_9EURY|nr:SagB/ThcOx family dehydrogenase [Methanosarcina flavescens]AYK16182.1 SagB/ThcOx family dehydrogenase [Methanosarcina flavescens]NLK31748.1 SagB/ThcOx family dehydrogenase [Methanosarcina flavescens]
MGINLGNQSPGDLPMKLRLPGPEASGISQIEELIAKRRSVRKYKDKKLSESVISRLLWAAQGISSETGLRTSPSAGALYPLEVHLIIGEGGELEPGVYRYVPEDHTLVLEISGDIREKLSKAALSQPMIKNAPVSIVISAVYARITSRYGNRGLRYTHMEAGHAAQNVYLLGVELGIGTCAIGAFKDEEVRSVLKLPTNQEPLYILPLGYV